MADLRDDRVVRASYLSQLLDLEGNDLKRVYEPISNQIGYILCFFVLLMTVHFLWQRYKKWKIDSVPKFIPQKVIQPPAKMLSEQQQSESSNPKKRICAVIGGTGFIGSHIVNELVSRGDYYVFVLGRKFRPERMNPDVDCLIQVDLADLDGLISSLQGVDSVINAAAFIPNVFMDKDETYSKNRMAFTHILRAAKAAKVKSLVHVSGFHMKHAPKEPVLAGFMNALIQGEREITEANGVDGLHTCVIGPCNILGKNSPFMDLLFTGKVTSLVMSSVMPVSFMPVEYLSKALVNAECKLANPDTVKEVGGKVLPFRGEPMSWEKLFALEGWPYKISKAPPFFMGLIVKLNVFFATLFRWAPFGPDVAPLIMEIMEAVEEEVPEEDIQEVYKVLNVGPPSPPLKDYVKLLAEKYKVEGESKKKQ